MDSFELDLIFEILRPGRCFALTSPSRVGRFASFCGRPYPLTLASQRRVRLSAAVLDTFRVREIVHEAGRAMTRLTSDQNDWDVTRAVVEKLRLECIIAAEIAAEAVEAHQRGREFLVRALVERMENAVRRVRAARVEEFDVLVCDLVTDDDLMIH